MMSSSIFEQGIVFAIRVVVLGLLKICCVTPGPRPEDLLSRIEGDDLGWVKKTQFELVEP